MINRHDKRLMFCDAADVKQNMSSNSFLESERQTFCIEKLADIFILDFEISLAKLFLRF